MNRVPSQCKYVKEGAWQLYFYHNPFRKFGFHRTTKESGFYWALYHPMRICNIKLYLISVKFICYSYYAPRKCPVYRVPSYPRENVAFLRGSADYCWNSPNVHCSYRALSVWKKNGHLARLVLDSAAAAAAGQTPRLSRRLWTKTFCRGNVPTQTAAAAAAARTSSGTRSVCRRLAQSSRASRVHRTRHDV